MLARSDLLGRLRNVDLAARTGTPSDSPVLSEWQRSGVRFVSSWQSLEDRYYRAVRELADCIRPMAGSAAMLQEGGIYLGCWLESTGTINTEILSRFLPIVAEATLDAFARHQRDDGLLPYKLTADGAAFAQIQLVTPPARTAWTHYCLNGRPRALLRRLYDAYARYDAWLAAHRDTRGTGGVEAFCCYDTGHDLSPRFWHLPDSPLHNDPATYDRDNPRLPLVAPDLTATVTCQRRYLALIAEELGEDPEPWRQRGRASETALFEQCHNTEDGVFYDREPSGAHLKVQSDVLLRVLAAEIGDDEFFAAALRRYLLNSRKFFAKYPFTSIALDDPRFNPAFDHNSWAGPTNLLSLIRAPHAFEAHGRHVELAGALHPALSALVRAERFPQTLDPFTGRAGFTESYSPAILCLLDFVERIAGIMPRPDGTLWFTCGAPQQIDHRDAAHETAYARSIDGRRFELVNQADGSEAWRDGELLFRCPRGVRIVTDRTGALSGLVGMSAGGRSGTVETPTASIPFHVAANEELRLAGGGFATTHAPGLVAPAT